MGEHDRALWTSFPAEVSGGEATGRLRLEEGQEAWAVLERGRERLRLDHRTRPL